MKYYSDKGSKFSQVNFLAEMTDDFFAFEDAYAQVGMAGGVISQRIIEVAAANFLPDKK